MSQIFYRPMQIFRSLSLSKNCGKPDWLLPTITLAVVSLSCSWFIRPILESDRNTIIKNQLLHLPVEQKKSALDIRKTARIISFLLLIILHFFILFAVGIVLFGLNKLLSGTASYEQAIAIYAYSSLIDVVKLLVITLITINTSLIDIHIGLGLLLNERVSRTFTNQVVSNIDIFDIWQVLIISIGLAVVGQISKIKTFGTILGLWCIWLVSNAFLANTIRSIMS